MSVFTHHIRTITIVIAIIAIAGCRFYFDTTKDHFTVPVTDAPIANGKNLTYNVCGGCHYDAAAKKFIGKHLNDLPAIAGKVVAANITKSVTHGKISVYTDAELSYLIKTGIAKNGKFMPYMLKPMMADEDINDIIAYLRSNDAAVAAADTTIGNTHINFIGKAGLRVSSKPADYVKGVSRPDENNAVEYGRYLVAVTGCYHCHSKKLLKVDFIIPENSKGYMQGGIKLKGHDGKKIAAPNLTPDTTTGIGAYDAADFSAAVRNGIVPGGRQLKPPMPQFDHLTDKQVNAIYDYVKRLQPVHHAVKKNHD